MPGLGGRKFSEQHARNTARVLNEINPQYIRSRPFYPWTGTPIHDEVARGDIELLSAVEQLQEIKQLVEGLEVTSKVCFDHAGNFWKNSRGGYLFSHGYEGYQFPEKKPDVLALIEEGLSVA